MDDKEDILEHLKQGLKVYEDHYYNGADPIESLTSSSIGTIDLGNLTSDISTTWDHNYGSMPNVTISSHGTTNTIWTTTGTNLYDDYTIQGAKSSGKISLKGEDADIEINGRSLSKTLDALADRLNLLISNPEMEKEWDELREIKEAYDAKLAECQEKSKMWKTLKSMPPPEVK